MTRRTTYAVATTASVLLGALVAIELLGSRTPPASVASPTPTTTASASTASTSPPAATSAVPSPTTSAITVNAFPSDAFGFVFYPDNRGVVRSEASDAEISSFAPQARSFTFYSRTVSPDGRSVAYWSSVRNGATLQVRPVTGGTARAVFTAATEMSGNAFTWSSDGTGLAVAIDNDCQEICGAQGGKAVNELWTVDLASGATEMVATGKIWLPVTWDRAANVVAAGVTGPGGYLTAYDLVDLKQKPYAVRSTEYRPTVMGRLQASSDARYVLLTFEQGPGSTGLAWWPLAQPEKRAAVEFDGAAAAWRPGTSQIWWVGGLTPAGCRVAPCSGTELVSFDVATGARTVAQRGTYARSLSAFRTDGTAAITSAQGSGPGTNTSDVTLVEIATGRTVKISLNGAFGGVVRLR